MDSDEPAYRVLLVGRSLVRGVLWGIVFGVATWSVIVVGSAVVAGGPLDELLFALAWSPLAGVVGGVLGAGISLVSGLALALSSKDVLQQLCWARLVSGSAAAAVPLAVAVNLHPPPSVGACLAAAGIAAPAAVTAVLLTPRILNGPSPRNRAARW